MQGTIPSVTDPDLSPRSPLWLAFEAASDMMALMRVESGPVFRIVAVNPAFLRSVQADGFGITQADLVDHTLADAVQHFSLAPREVDQLLQRYKSVVEQRLPLQFEVALTTPSGIHSGHLRLTPILDVEGRCQYVLYSSCDTTERTRALNMLNQSEEKFARVPVDPGRHVHLATE